MKRKLWEKALLIGTLCFAGFTVSLQFEPVQDAYAQIVSSLINVGPGNDKTFRVGVLRDQTGSQAFSGVVPYGRDNAGTLDPFINDSTKGLLVWQGAAGSTAWPVSIAPGVFPTVAATPVATNTPTTIPNITVAGTVAGAGENAVTTPTSGKQIEVVYSEFSVATASSNGARFHFQATVTAGNMIAGHTDMPAGAAVLYNPPPIVQDGVLKPGGRRGGTNDPLYLNLTDAETVDYVVHYKEITP